MIEYLNSINTIITKKQFPQEINKIYNILNIYQSSVVAFLILEYIEDSSDAQIILEKIFIKFPKIYSYLSNIYTLNLNLGKEQEIDTLLPHILLNLYNKNKIGQENLDYIINRLTIQELDQEFIGIFLILIFIKGLHIDDIYNLTISMKNSGRVYDYRDYFVNKKIIRRYPTGALSEKVALILPSMLSIMGDHYPIISTFLVAKTLSFTGGTWDKLGILENFSFPNPGRETIEVLNKCNVAMTVTKDDLCPADRILYQVRSITGTVNSIPLAVASIASKQLACPADLLLLDVRHGEGAFFEESEALKLAELINIILIKEGFHIINSFIKMDEPNGIGIGNHLELCEAISIMKNEKTVLWDTRAINEQKNIVINFFAEIMNYYLSEYSIDKWENIGKNLFMEGKIIKRFKELLIAHGVPKVGANSLVNDPFNYFKLAKISDVKSKNKGMLKKIYQKDLGNIINFGFLSNDNTTKNIEIMLNKRLNDLINIDETICHIYCVNSDIDINNEIISKIQSCFVIE